MINFSFTSPRASVLAFPCDMGSATDASRREGIYLLERLMGNDPTRSPSMRSSSDDKVIADFLLWVDSVQNKTWSRDAVNCAFTYFNMNTGDSVIFVAWFGYEDFAVDTQWDGATHNRTSRRIMAPKISNIDVVDEVFNPEDQHWYVRINGVMTSTRVE